MFLLVRFLTAFTFFWWPYLLLLVLRFLIDALEWLRLPLRLLDYSLSKTASTFLMLQVVFLLLLKLSF